VEPAIPGSLSHLKLSRSALHTPFLRGSALCLRSVPPSPGLPPGTGFLRPETGAPNVPKRRDLCAETQEPPSPIAKNRPKMGLSAGRSSTASFGGLDGGGCSPAKPVSASLSAVIPCYLKFFRGKDSPPFAAGGCMPQVSRCILPMISGTKGVANQRKCGLLAG
jgi:hypothetical protein